MEKTYKNIGLFFVAIFVIVFLGFFKTYFGLFPTFTKVTTIQHIHGLMFVLWFLMLIIQPVLIQKRKYKWHRMIGKFSYFLVPLIVISIFFIAKELYETAPATQSQKIATLYIPFYQIVDFITLYLLAIYYKKKIFYHLRYMIATSLAVYGAALKRFFTNFLGVTVLNGFLYTFIITDLILLGFILYDKMHGKDNKPYVVSLIILLASQFGFYFLRNSDLWQTVCGKFVSLFYS